MEPIQVLAKKWLDLDQDHDTRSEIHALLQQNDEAELEQRLRKRIAFGTAGLRAAMKAGFAYMNCLTVLQASLGLAQYILDQTSQTAGAKDALSVVVGYDARYNSEKFARLTAAALLSKGFAVLWFGQLVHTPMVPFCVSHYGAAAGVMVTASHNPKNDNGYKVYWSNGSQIIPPHDVGIAKAIDEVTSVSAWDTTLVDRDPLVKKIFDEATEAYFDTLRSVTSFTITEAVSDPFTYTPMHGVGLPFMQRAAEFAGFAGGLMKVVDAQAQPDPEFPTVSFPNPEEAGALGLAMKNADENGCSIVLANDPDADRLAVAERRPDGTWHQFSGNQTGVLLASYIFETYKSDRSKMAMLASTVSSRMLAAIARKEGFTFRDTLTGFKWLGNVAQDLQKQGLAPAFAYEEAIGYMLPSVVWDKDGVAAGTVFLSAVQFWKQQGLTPWQKLQRLYEKYGYFEDANTYLISPSPHITDTVFGDIRTSNHGSRPLTLGARKILRWRDLTLGHDSAGKDGKPDLPIDPTAQMLTCELENVVFTARGSGTEPKIKIYIEAIGKSSNEAKSVANEVLNDLLVEWFKPVYGLRLAGT